MAKVKYDISDVDIQDLGDFEQAPVGLYRFRIAEATVGKSNAGQPMLTVVLELTHDAKGKKLTKRYGRIWHRVPLEHWDDTAGWTFRLKEFLSALGLKLKGTIDPDKLEDMTGMVKLRSGKDLDDNYRPEVGKLMKLADDEEEDEPDEDDEDEEEEETEEDEDDEEEEEGEWDEEQLGELSTKDLKSVADEFGVDVPARLTSKSKTSLIAAILEAQSGGGEEEDEDEEDEEEEETETEDYSDWSRNQLIKEARSRDMKVKKSDDDDDIRQWLIDSDSSDDDEEEEDEGEEEEEETSYGDWELDDLKNELKERGLKATGPKNVLVKRLEKDDESKEDPF